MSGPEKTTMKSPGPEKPPAKTTGPEATKTTDAKKPASQMQGLAPAKTTDAKKPASQMQGLAPAKTTDAKKPASQMQGLENAKKPASQMQGLEGSTTKMTPSENFRYMEKRRRIGSAVDKRGALARTNTEDSLSDGRSFDDLQEKEEPKPRDKEDRDRLIIGIILGFLSALLLILIIILIWYLLDCQNSLIERARIQKTELDELRRCSLLKVGFTATFSDEQAKTQQYVKMSDDQTAVFQEVVESTGGGYSPQTGHFTATVPGLYSFQIHVVGYSNNVACLELRKDGQVGAYKPVRAVATAGGDQEAGSNAAVVQMAAGDRMWAASCELSNFRTGAGDAAYGRSTTFSGHLVKPIDCATISSKKISEMSETSKAGRLEVSLGVLTALLVCCGALLYSRVLQPLMG